MVTNLLLLITGLVLLVLVYQCCRFLVLHRVRGTAGKLYVARREERAIWLLAGEIAPSFYHKFFDYLEETRRSLEIKIVAGPWMLLSHDKFKDYVDPTTGKLQPKGRENFWDLHPVFKYCKDHSDRVKVFVKHKALDRERHFGLAVGSKVVYVEFHHGREACFGGRLYTNDDEVYDIKKSEFETLMDRKDLYTELTEANLDRLLQIEAVQFADEDIRSGVRS